MSFLEEDSRFLRFLWATFVMVALLAYVRAAGNEDVRHG